MTPEGDVEYKNYFIPLKSERVATIRRPYPVDEHDMNQLRKFLDLLEITVETSPRQKEATDE